MDNGEKLIYFKRILRVFKKKELIIK